LEQNNPLSGITPVCNHPDIYFSALPCSSRWRFRILSQSPQWQVGYLPEVAILHSGYQKSAILNANKFDKAGSDGRLLASSHRPLCMQQVRALYVQTGVARGIELLERGLALVARMLLLCMNPLPFGHCLHSPATSESGDRPLSSSDPDSYLPEAKLSYNLGNLRKATGDLTGLKRLMRWRCRLTQFCSRSLQPATLKALGCLKDATAAYQQAIQLNPTYAQAQNLGSCCLNLVTCQKV